MKHADWVKAVPNAPIIVAATLGETDFQWLDGLRRAHFPPDRNMLPAHLTLFHHLPPSIREELDRRLSDATRRRRPAAMASGVMNLGRGVAIRIRSPDLEEIRAECADAFRNLLMPQDASGWRPHVTVQNKVQPAEAGALHETLARDFRPRSVTITGIASWWYRGGPWELIKTYAFR